MSTEKSVRQIAEEWNAKARAEGTYLDQDPWSLPNLYEGSILDVPLTPDAEKRIAQLRAGRLDRERVAREQSAALARGQQEARMKVQRIAPGALPPAAAAPPADAPQR